MNGAPPARDLRELLIIDEREWRRRRWRRANPDRQRQVSAHLFPVPARSRGGWLTEPIPGVHPTRRGRGGVPNAVIEPSPIYVLDFSRYAQDTKFLLSLLTERCQRQCHFGGVGRARSVR